MTNESHSREPASKRGRILIILAVLALFVGVLAAKVITDSAGAKGEDQVAAAGGADSITSVHNDAVLDYEAALSSGKPIYVLFHSLTCDPCIEISEVADRVVPFYEGQVTFVNVITDDPSGQALASDFSFQYIPTSFFLAPGGEVVDSFTGAMSESDMDSYLDALLAEQ